MNSSKPSEHLLKKRWLLPITNICNLHCGGCAQFCGHFEKEKLWSLSVDEIDKYIKLVKPYCQTNWNEFTIFGGEPTVHPEWNRIVDLLYSHAPMTFRVNTNGRLGHKKFEKQKNITYYVDFHPDDQEFVSTMIAAIDVLNIDNKAYYWEKAQETCKIWKREGAMVYRGKAYFCEHAASMDWLYNNGENGWAVQEGVNPFLKTDDEIALQAEKFCHRCAWCIEEKLPRQRVSDPSLITKTNYENLDSKKLVQLTFVSNK